MPIAPDPVDTIERFAELSALLNDPHALRAALLAGVGLDERAWRAIEQRWMERVRAPGGEALAQRLSERYAAMLRNLSESIPPTEPGGATAEQAAAVPPAIHKPAPPPSAVRPPPSPRVARSPLADTLDSPQGLPLRPALPFRPAP